MNESLPGNPWLTIWLKPRGTIRWIVETDPKQQVIMLAILAGIVESLGTASSNSLGDRWSLAAILIVSLMVGPIRGLASLYLGGALLYWVGRLLKGQASPVEVRAAIAWSQVPVIWSGLLLVPQFLLFGEELFTAVTPRIDSNPLLLAALFGFGIIEIIIGGWSFIIGLKCLSEVSRFSVWKALATILIPIFGIAVIIIAILLIVGPLIY
jgi:hypothetical protein